MPFVYEQFQISALSGLAPGLATRLVNAGWTQLGTAPPGFTHALRSAPDAQNRAVRVALGASETIGTVTYDLVRVASDDAFTAHVITKGVYVPNSSSTYPNMIQVWASPQACVFKSVTTDSGGSYIIAFGLAQTPSQSTPTNQPAPIFLISPREAGSATVTTVTFCYGALSGRLFGIAPGGAVSAGNLLAFYGNDNGLWNYGSQAVYACLPLPLILNTTPATYVGHWPNVLITPTALTEGVTISIGSTIYKVFGVNNTASKVSLLCQTA